jgi:hypothetical protein
MAYAKKAIRYLKILTIKWAIKNVLLENINRKVSLQYDLALINKISQTESTIKASR